MKKSYQAPKLNSYGTVSQLTAASGEFGFSDFTFQDKGTPTSGTGSVNLCYNNSGTCNNPLSKDPQYKPTRN